MHYGGGHRGRPRHHHYSAGGITMPDKSKPKPTKPATVTLFTFNGVEYKVPAKVKPIVQLRYMDRVRKDGPQVATTYLIPAVLGEDTWQALLEEEDLEQEHVEAIGDAVRQLMGGEGLDIESFSDGQQG